MDKWDLPISDRKEELYLCECGTEYDPQDGDTCLDCQDAYLDAMESRIDREEYYHDD